jgi:hypothetical protein
LLNKREGKIMPNWCSNNITIQGPTETLKTLWNDATEVVGENNEERGLLQAMVPMPSELNHTEGLSDGPNWYDWRVSNWGTKWDISREGLEFTDNGDGTASIAGWFESAWAPPIEAYNRFLDDMDNCSIVASYYEPGMDFAGLYDNGEDLFMEDVTNYFRHTPVEEWGTFEREVEEEWNIVEQIEMWDEECEDA